MFKIDKPIDSQNMDKLQQVKHDLDKQFTNTNLELNFDHMRMTIGKILKTR
jgi:hypothetical protein